MGVDHILIKKDIGDKMNLHFGTLREKLHKNIPYTGAPREKIGVSKRHLQASKTSYMTVGSRQNSSGVLKQQK